MDSCPTEELKTVDCVCKIMASSVQLFVDVSDFVCFVPLERSLGGQQFQRDKPAVGVILRLHVQTWISLLRALMYYFPAGTYASIEAVIMVKNCVRVCVYVCVCARARACMWGGMHNKFVPSVICSVTVSVCILL
jgi:hypothetical protein